MCGLQLTEEVCNLKPMHLKVDVVEKYWTRSTELTKVMFSSSGKKNIEKLIATMWKLVDLKQIFICNPAFIFF